MTDPPVPPLRRLWMNLRSDPSFRATFFGAVVIPGALGIGLVAWIVVQMLRGG